MPDERLRVFLFKIMRTFIEVFQNESLSQIEKEINSYLFEDDVEYVDLKYCVINDGDRTYYSAILICKEIK